MRILVTGGAGFIGSHTVDLLVEKGHDVRIVDNLTEQVHQSKVPSYLNKKAEFIKADISELNLWGKFLDDIDAVIHLASMTGISQSMYKPEPYCRSNIIGTANLYETLVNEPSIRKKIKKIIVASSKTVYGEGAYKCNEHGLRFPDLRPLKQLEKKDWELHCPKCREVMQFAAIPENKPHQSLSVYALTKQATEKMSLMYGSMLDIPTIAFRYFSVFGPRQSLSNPYTGVCSIFLSRIENGHKPVIFEDGNQIRDFIYVGDIARANLLALEESKQTAVYNVGSGKGISIKQVASTVGEVLGKDVDPEITEDFRYGDTRNDLSDNSKIERDFHFRPEYSFKEGVEKLVEWSKTTEAVDKFEEAENERKKLLNK